MKKLLIFGAILFVIVSILESDHLATKIRETEKRLDSLNILTQKVVKFDSIQTAQEHRFLDSLEVIKTKLQDERELYRKESQKLRQKNQDIERRYRSINLPDLPVY